MDTDNSVAKKNQAKINKFVTSLIMQCVVFGAVLFATVAGNAFAQGVLVAYTVYICIAVVIYSAIFFLPMDMLVKRDLGSLKDVNMPSVMVSQTIATVFSLVEVAIFISFGHWILATVWVVGEIGQYALRHKIRRVVAAQGDDFIDPDTLLHEKIDPVFEQYQQELIDIESQMRPLLNDGHLPPEGSLNRKEFDELEAKRDALSTEFTEKLFQAALDRINE